MLSFCCHAQEKSTEIVVRFRVNVARIDSGYDSNKINTDTFISFLHSLHADSTANITSLSLFGAASPEGSYALNHRLAQARMSALEKLIRREVVIPDSLIQRDDAYIPWQYLREKVNHSGEPYSAEVIAIIDEQPVLVTDPLNGKTVDRRILKLRTLENGKVWRELFARYFSGMRSASAIVTYTTAPVAAADTVLTFYPVSSLAECASPVLNLDVVPFRTSVHPVAKKTRKPFYMSVRTNMIYDALAVPNLGVDFYLGKGFSLSASWMHAWWSYDPRHRYWRLYGGEINARRWFGAAARKKPLTGHHVGIYAQAITYDFEFGGTAYMGGEPGGTLLERAHLGTGLEYGYSLPVARHFNLDFSLGIGYLT